MTLILSRRDGAKGWTCDRRCPQRKGSKRRGRAYAPQANWFLGTREQRLFSIGGKTAMRTAADFNLYYAAPDPWHISHARFRDNVLRRRLKPFIRDKSVLELGCGEGHLTQTIFSKAR